MGDADMSFLEIRNLCVSYPAGEDGARLRVLEDFSLTLAQGEFLVVTGKSGCGKTTLLRTIGGFLAPDDGSILLDGAPVQMPGKDRMMIFQSFDQLFPWFSVKENLCYAMKKTGIPAKERDAAAERFLADTGLTAFANACPNALSGGMKQRAALARALSLQPLLFLMDEPFSSLDEETRLEMHDLIRRLIKEQGKTAILVTHDREEAKALGDRIISL